MTISYPRRCMNPIAQDACETAKEPKTKTNQSVDLGPNCRWSRNKFVLSPLSLPLLQTTPSLAPSWTNHNLDVCCCSADFRERKKMLGSTNLHLSARAGGIPTSPRMPSLGKASSCAEMGLPSFSGATDTIAALHCIVVAPVCSSLLRLRPECLHVECVHYVAYAKNNNTLKLSRGHRGQLPENSAVFNLRGVQRPTCQQKKSPPIEMKQDAKSGRSDAMLKVGGGTRSSEFTCQICHISIRLKDFSGSRLNV